MAPRDPTALYDRSLIQPRTLLGRPRLTERYEDLGPIATGGMGEVRRVWDSVLNRTLAMKILRRELLDREDLYARFVEEAQATGQLEHPGIVPIYDFGRLNDGRAFFTMKEIRGRTMLDVIEELHRASRDGWGQSSGGWTLYRVIGVLNSVCTAIAYAHDRGVLHRDLKPTNVMVGAFAEVVVMDWGLAKISRGRAAADAGQAATGKYPVFTARSRQQAFMTRVGSVAGTPNYMPPEQARGDHAGTAPRSDVYALGAILYHILANRPPYEGPDTDSVVQLVLDGPPPPPIPPFAHRNPGKAVDDTLLAICDKAMSRRMEDRYADAGSLGATLAAWIEGVNQREQALILVDRADRMRATAEDLRRQAGGMRNQAARILEQIGPFASAEQKATGWALEDQASRLEDDARVRDAQTIQWLRSAMTHTDLPEARQRLEAIAAPESRPLPQGTGVLTLGTDPPGAKVTLRRLELVGRRLVPVSMRNLGASPIHRLELPSGSYIARLEAEGRVMVCYPVRIDPEGHHADVPPGQDEPRDVRLPPIEQFDAGDLLVPAGWATLGGDRETADSLPRQPTWVDAFVIRRDPVTCQEFLEFLHSLPASEAASLAPTGFVDSGEWRLGSDETGQWMPDQPVRAMPWDAAERYAAWMSSRTGQPWRLPSEHEWEKAARGVDERIYPWGDFLDPTFCCVADSHPTEVARPAAVDAFPQDTSPYGVRGMGGNVRDLVRSHRAPPGPTERVHRMVRGGWYDGLSMFSRSALRYRYRERDRAVGFRLVRSL
jgi:serine/threonine-protein kinase